MFLGRLRHRFTTLSTGKCHLAAFRNALWLLSEKGLLLGSGFIFTVILTRYWSVAELGEFQYILALLALLSPFSSLGLNSLVSRELVSRTKDSGTIVGTAIVLRLLGAAFGGLCFSLLSFWLISPDLRLLFFILLVAQLSHAFSVIDFCFEAKVQSKVSAILRTVIGLTFMGAKLIAVVKGASFAVILVVIVIEWGVLAGAWLYVYRIHQGALRQLTWCSKQAKYFIKRCGWLMLSSLAAIIYLKIDQVMLGMMASSDAVAYYSIASRLSEVWYLIPGVMVASLYPGLMKMKNEGVAYEASLQKLTNWLCWSAIFIALCVSASAPWFVPLLFGSVYAPVTTILHIHIWAGVFVFMRALFSKWLLIEDIPKYSLLTHGFGATINLTLNALFIPYWGGVGAAWATLISYAVASYLALFLFPKTRFMAKLMTKAICLPIWLLLRRVSG